MGERRIDRAKLRVLKLIRRLHLRCGAQPHSHRGRFNRIHSRLLHRHRTRCDLLRHRAGGTQQPHVR